MAIGLMLPAPAATPTVAVAVVKFPSLIATTEKPLNNSKISYLSSSSSSLPIPLLPSLLPAAPKPLRRKLLCPCIKFSASNCLVFPPPPGHKPLAVVMFLGGAFVGATPELTYRHLMELLAKEGFLVISVPYGVSFDHEAAAREVYRRFQLCFDEISSQGIPDAEIAADDVSGLPFFSIGHSNGALLQLIIGCYFSERLPEANVIVSFNNRPATEAVPYFDQIGLLASQVIPYMETLPAYSMARNVSSDAWKFMLESAGAIIQDYDEEVAVSVTKFVDQLPSVMLQVQQGVSEFKPTPSENREFFQKSYAVRNTMLVKFSNDAIDETNTLEDILRPRVHSIGGELKKVVLPGNHLTPCVQDLSWETGARYTPADAVAQSLKTMAVNDTRALSRSVTDWLKSAIPSH